jgi:hypothetical protein
MVYTARNGTPAVVDDTTGEIIGPDNDPAAWATYRAWLAAGNTPTPAPAAPTPVPTCLLWQLEAACSAPPAGLGFTPPTWVNVSSVVAAQNNPTLSAFFAVGTNPIPANSTTLLALAAATSPVLTSAQVATLIQAASLVSIP